MTGFLFIGVSLRCVVTIAAGAISTPATLRAGNNVTHDNTVAASAGIASNAVFNTGVNSLTAMGVATTAQLDLATPIVIDVTIAATGTGAFAYVIKPIWAGFIIPNPFV